MLIRQNHQRFGHDVVIRVVILVLIDCRVRVAVLGCGC